MDSFILLLSILLGKLIIDKLNSKNTNVKDVNYVVWFFSVLFAGLPIVLIKQGVLTNNVINIALAIIAFVYFVFFQKDKVFKRNVKKK